MCVERVHRMFIAFLLGFVMMFAGMQMFKLAFLLQLFIMIMLLIWALTDFCPSFYILKKVFPSCYSNKESNGEENN